MNMVRRYELVPATGEPIWRRTLRHGFYSWETEIGMVTLHANVKN